MPKTGEVGGRRKAHPGRAVAAEVYERLCKLNQALQEARGCLQDLGAEELGMFSSGQLGPYEELVEEAQVAINSLLLGELETRETARAGWLFRRRKAREAAEEKASAGT